MKVLVTGAAGFIGGYLVERLFEEHSYQQPVMRVGDTLGGFCGIDGREREARNGPFVFQQDGKAIKYAHFNEAWITSTGR